jgi:hypothetical protein
MREFAGALHLIPAKCVCPGFLALNFGWPFGMWYNVTRLENLFTEWMKIAPA